MQCPGLGAARDTDKGDQLQRLLTQSGDWQQQLDHTPGALTPFTAPTAPITGATRQQQLQQLRQRLTPAESR